MTEGGEGVRRLIKSVSNPLLSPGNHILNIKDVLPRWMLFLLPLNTIKDIHTNKQSLEGTTKTNTQRLGFNPVR